MLTFSLRAAAFGAALSALASAQSVTTTFVGGNSGTTTWTNQFDLAVLNPAGIRITAFDVNCENTRAGGVGSAFNLQIYATALGGTYVGNQTNPAVWNLISSGNGVSRPLGQPTAVYVTDFYLAPGTYGIAIQYNGTAMAYTNGTGANQVYGNNDLQLSLGSSTTGLFAAPLYNPRVWNGTVYYFAGPATWRSFEPGCSGSAGQPRLVPAAGSAARLGQLFTLEVQNLPVAPTPVFLQIGLSSALWNGIPLPLSLQPLGAAGCSLLVSDEVVIGGSGVQTASFALPVPSAPLYFGVNAYFQALVFEPGANALGLTVSNGGDAYLGT
ncbi:MAG: hypothetical protein IPN34_26410 [Planctomycetes bacterium]|nr:hypothetical protein [Planctomycetota bacterium]